VRPPEQTAVLKVWWRVVPLLIPVVFCAYLDRVNLGFAALTMNRALGLTETQFGLAGGLFSLGYAAASIPSTLMLHRIGARRWISAMMLMWGISSMAQAFATTPQQLMGLRLAIGVAEAGLAPGTVLYIGRWFPASYRGRVLASFFLINPVSQMLAGAVSSLLLTVDGFWGLAGWQWIFLGEGLPSLLVVGFVFGRLPDTMADAPWLTSEEVGLLGTATHEDEAPGRASAAGGAGIRQALANGRIWLLVAVSAGLGTSGIGTIVFLPLIVKSMGFSIPATGLVAALPAAAAAAALPLWGLWVDKTRQREVIVASGCGLIAVGLLGAALLLPSAWAIVPVGVALVAFFGCLPAFWSLPAALLTGAGAAAGIALINLVGNLGQFAGPYLLGRLSDLEHSYTGGLIRLSVVAAIAAVIASVPRGKNRAVAFS
jgi:MFS family permease